MAADSAGTSADDDPAMPSGGITRKLPSYKIPNFLVAQTALLTASPTVMLFLIVGVLPVAGMFIGSVPAVIIFVPLLRPLAENADIPPSSSPSSAA